jgi:hypothetical protein
MVLIENPQRTRAHRIPLAHCLSPDRTTHIDNRGFPWKRSG